MKTKEIKKEWINVWKKNELMNEKGMKKRMKKE